MNIIINEIPPETHGQWIGIDLEISGMNEKQLHRPTSGKFALMSIAIGENVYVINEEKNIMPAMSRISDNWHIFHHAKFDITHLRRWTNYPPRNKVWDTMLIERILFGGYYDSVALNDLTRRYLFTHMKKELQKSFVGSEITSEQIHYAALDAYVLPKIVEEQKKLMNRNDFNVWMEIDRPAMFAFMDFQGFVINVDAWKDLAIRNKIRKEQAENELPFNPNSNGIKGQAVKFYRDNGFPNINNNQEETLEKFIEKYPDTLAAEMAQKVLVCKKYGTRLSKYGLHFIEDFLEKDETGNDMIYADYWVTGAETGRTSCSDPNMQNIPVRDTKEFRECFIARPNHKLLIADYSAQEPFISAYLSQDPALLDVCNSGKDIYILMAKLMYGVDITKQDPMRARMKAVVLGGNYGQSVQGLARKEGISIAEAEEVIAKRRKAFPRYDEYMRVQAKSRNKVKTVAGRTIHLNHYSGQAERNALNAPIQGSAGDCMKKALGNIHKNWVNNFPILFDVVGYIHDELILDVPIGWEIPVRDYVQKIMVDTADAMFPGLHFKADVSIGDTWADK